MAAYHAPIMLTPTAQPVGPFPDKVWAQPLGDDMAWCDVAPPAGAAGIRVFEGAVLEIPAGTTIYVRACSRGSGAVLNCVKALA